MPQIMESNMRQFIVNLAMKFMGVPYLWGGCTPAGFDCSGFIIWVLQVFGILPSGDWTADGLMTHFKRTAIPQPGDLVFFGKATTNTPTSANIAQATHVMMYIGKLNNIDMCVGASGGDHTCTNIGIAKAKNAMVKIKPVNYRTDFIGYGSIISEG